jgi:hypothetical protein
MNDRGNGLGGTCSYALCMRQPARRNTAPLFSCGPATPPPRGCPCQTCHGWLIVTLGSALHAAPTTVAPRSADAEVRPPSARDDVCSFSLRQQARATGHRAPVQNEGRTATGGHVYDSRVHHAQPWPWRRPCRRLLSRFFYCDVTSFGSCRKIIKTFWPQLRRYAGAKSFTKTFLRTGTTLCAGNMFQC